MARRVTMPSRAAIEEHDHKLAESCARMALGQPMAEARKAVGLEPVDMPAQHANLFFGKFAGRLTADEREESFKKQAEDPAACVNCGKGPHPFCHLEEARTGFSLLLTEELPGGGAVHWYANDGARYLVIVDELRMKFGAGIPKGALVYVDPPEGASEAECEAATRAAKGMGAQAVKVLPTSQKGTGAAPQADSQAADMGIREAVDVALEAVPADVREGARARADQFLSEEGL